MGQDFPLINLVKINQAKLVYCVKKTLVHALYLISPRCMQEKTGCRFISSPIIVSSQSEDVWGGKLNRLPKLILRQQTRIQSFIASIKS